MRRDISILFNLTPMGGSIKTGIYRVAHHLLTGVSRHSNIKANYHAYHDIVGSVAYYRMHLASTGSKLIQPLGISWLIKVRICMADFLISSAGNRSLAFKTIRRFAAIGITLIENVSLRVILSNLGRPDIYHSPFCSVPKSIRECPGIARFTTIYDLLPITNPEYFEGGIIPEIKSLISGLTEDDYTFSISSYTREVLLATSKCLPERSFVAPLAASDHFYPVPEGADRNRILQLHGIPESGYILTLCTLEIRKNVEHVVRAFVKLHHEKRLPMGTKLVLVGGKGWKTQNLENALEFAGDFRDLIIMPGFVPDEDLAAVYSAAHLFAYMSFAEGFGLPPLEAMQCGVPVITSNTTSLPEVVGDSGIMLSPSDLEGLCNAIEKLYHDKEFHSSLSIKALSRAKCFSWENFIDDNVKGYQCALESGRTS